MKRHLRRRGSDLLPFIRSPQHFSEHLQLAELPPQLAEPALLVKLSGGETHTRTEKVKTEAPTVRQVWRSLEELAGVQFSSGV